MARTKGRSRLGKIPAYAWIFAVAFFCFFILFVALLAYADKLNRLGLTEQVYYLVLVLMGLASAVFLFGLLRSSATYEGKLYGGTLRLGGPIVGAGIVVVGGYFFIPKATTFPFTVFVHGESGQQDIVLRNSGLVFIKLGPEIVTEPIGEGGQAFFPAIPANFRGQRESAWVESERYVAVSYQIKLDGLGTDLSVKKIIRTYKLGGMALDPAGNPLPGVKVSLPFYKLEHSTDLGGRFDFEVAAESPDSVDLVAQKPGYQTVRLSPTLGDTGVNFSLKRGQ